MKKISPKQGLRVCLLSSHPLFLEQFQQLLLSAGLAARALQLAPTAKVRAISLPRDRVYVLDAYFHRQPIDQLIVSILDRHPKTQVIVLADDFTEAGAFPLLSLGVKGLLKYSEASRQLVRAIEAVAAGGFWVSRHFLSRFVDTILTTSRTRQLRRRPTHLSSREQEVLTRLLDNFSNKEIATKLNISERTVKFHVSNLLAKYGVQRRADLILLSYQGTDISRLVQ